MTGQVAASVAPDQVVERLDPDLWRIELPLPLPGLSSVNVYAIDTPKGVYLVDAGWDFDAGFDGLSAGLSVFGRAMADVRGVIVTHSHPDHLGLAERVRAASDAWVCLHRVEAEVLDSVHQSRPAVSKALHDVLVLSGVTGSSVDDLVNAPMPPGAYIDRFTADRVVDHGDRFEIPGWDLRAVWTPGHTVGHLCAVTHDRRWLFTGDHVLPGITPAVGVGPHSGEEPLHDFLDSLDLVRSLDALRGLPAHRPTFPAPAERAEAIQLHHRERLQAVIDQVGAGLHTAAEITQVLRWSSWRAWEQLEAQHQRAAILETEAHLRELGRRGQAGVTVRSGVESWFPAS